MKGTHSWNNTYIVKKFTEKSFDFEAGTDKISMRSWTMAARLSPLFFSMLDDFGWIIYYDSL